MLASETWVSKLLAVAPGTRWLNAPAERRWLGANPSRDGEQQMMLVGGHLSSVRTAQSGSAQCRSGPLDVLFADPEGKERRIRRWA
jgi:hypothetical protein